MAGSAELRGRWYPEGNSLGLTELEVSSGIVLGRSSEPEAKATRSEGPLDCLRQLAIGHLLRPPCVVSFSGGRDSSALLAVYLEVARREGVEPPIALTARWDDDDASDESAWQEAVIRHLKAPEWHVMKPEQDFDLLGAHARLVLHKAGVLFPAMSYVMVPMMERARGGVFVNGEGGDESLGLWSFGRFWADVRSRRIPRESDIREITLRCLPRSVRRRRWQRNSPPYQTWLRSGAYRLLAMKLADELGGDPLRWDRYQPYLARLRSTELTVASYRRVAELAESEYAGPFLETRFLEALGQWGGKFGEGDRASVMTSLFGELLPRSILTRESKASFGSVVWGPESRRFAEEWDGSGLDPEVVDPVRLRQAWLAPVPVHGAILPLHAAWAYGARATEVVV